MSASQIKQKLKQQHLLNAKNLAGFTSNHQLSATLNGVEKSAGESAAPGEPKKPNHLTHIQSYQSLSSVAMVGGTEGGLTGTKSTNKLSHLALANKPLNRNSRRASMSELGYGKIESYNKLDKLGEVIWNL